MLRWRLFAAGLAAAAVLLAPAAAEAGTFGVQADGTLLFTGEDVADQIAGFETLTSIRFTRFGGPELGGGPGCEVSPDFQSVDCAKGAIVEVRLDLGGGDDVAAVAAGMTVPVRFVGGDGADGLFGGGGIDRFDGGDGNDNIVSRDTRAEELNCGFGNDTAISDDADLRLSCEQIEGDADGDGVRRPADCDDTNPGIRPGAGDPPDDRVDQDCSGADTTNLDVDGDGFARPQDCNDGDGAIRPGAREVRGNGVDENCDTRIEPFPGIGGRVSNEWAPSGARTRNVTLSARDFPAGTRLQMRCSGRGCPFRRVTRRIRNRGRVNLHGPFGRGRLGRGATVELRFTRAGRVGRVLRFKIGATPGVPAVRFLCAPPGQRDRDC